MGFLRRQGPWEKNNQAVYTRWPRCSQVQGQGSWGLGSADGWGEGAVAGVDCPGLWSQPDPGVARSKLWLPGTR